jgi:fibronectin-binding autotransporter adhesin
MSNITVNVTNAGGANVSVTNGSTVNATVGNGGVVNVALGNTSTGNATVVSGTLTINSTTTLAAGSSAFAKNVGTLYAAKLDLGIPAGPATLVSVGNTTTLAAGSNATVNGTTSGSNLTLAFGIPRGANGVTPSFAIGNVVTGAAGSSASVTATTTNSGANVTLDLTIPRGDPGTSGSNGTNGTSITLSNGTPANLGTASAGTSNLAARADHIHTLPVIAYGNLSGVPTNFPTNTTLVSGLNSSYSGINHGHNYVTALNNLTGALTLAAGSNVTLTANGSTLTLAATAGLGANDVIDGGDFVGEIIASITFLNQPQSVTVNLGQTLSWANGTNTSRYLLQSGNAALGVQLNGQTANIATYSNIAAAAVTTTTVANLALFNTPIATVSLAGNGTRSLIQIWQDQGSVATETLRSDDGTTWSRLTVPRPSRHVAAGALGWVADAYGDTGVALTSADGLSWSTRSLPFSSAEGDYSRWRFAVGASAIVGVCGDSSRVARSANGASWSSVTVGTSALIGNVAFGNGRFVSLGSRVGGSTGDSAYTSSDGSTWSRSNLPTGGYDKISFANGRFIALRAGGSGADATTDAAMSTDGSTWALQTLPSSQLWRAAVYAGSYAVSDYAGSTGNSLAIASEPAAGSANLTVSATASTGATVGYQWQRSTDAGTTWLNVANATNQALALNNVTLPDGGTRYRVLATATGVPSATSSTALLTVN